MKVLSCAMFLILNKFENLDGAISVFSPEVKSQFELLLAEKRD